VPAVHWAACALAFFFISPSISLNGHVPQAPPQPMNNTSRIPITENQIKKTSDHLSIR